MKIVLVAGHFNPLHEGHIDHFKKARALGDYLIVSVNSDKDCIRKSGYSLPLETRMAVVEELRCVDCAIESFPSGGNQVETLKRILPDIFAKGGDRTPDNMNKDEIKICEQLGIEIVYGIGDQLNSSSKLMGAIRNADN